MQGMKTGVARVIIVGAGHSGSKYISTLLNCAGVDCGHEQLFRLHTNPNRSRLVESSLYAMPKVERYGFDGAVYHQVRDPSKTLSSLINNYRIYKHYNHKHRLFRVNNFHEPPPDIEDDWTGWMIRHLADWLERCDRVADHTYRVEDVDANVVSMIAESAGVDIDTDTIYTCLAATSKTTNKHPDGPKLTWDDIAKYDGSDRFISYARQYGYVED